MASSPPGPSHTPLSNPKKRPSIGLHSLTTQPDLKRLKIQPHPLRQSSYPESGATGFYASQTPHSARSETGSVANSLVAGSVASTTTGKKRRGRPRKSTQLNEEDVSASQNAETRGSGALTGDGKSLVSGRGHTGEAEADEADDDDDDDDDEDTTEERPVDEQEQQRRAEENQRMDRLLDALSADQNERYAQWRRSKINKPALRKIVNQTVSQSVTAQPLQAIMVYSKNYIGEVIEKARAVQEERARARDVAVRLEREERVRRREAVQAQLAEKRERYRSRTPEGEEGRETSTDYRVLGYEINQLDAELNRLRNEEKAFIPNQHCGGLLPEHVREGLRRYKADGDGGGVGFSGLSHSFLGAHGSATWRAGRGLGASRLFR